jgi:hypothetical protein
MKQLRAIAVCFVAAVLLTECAPATRFTWGGYEDSLYRFYKNPSDREAYKMSLTNAIAVGRERNDIAPGLLAELGYMYLEDGDSVRAAALFREEMQLFPESQPFLTRIIDRATGRPVMGGMS